MQKTVTLYPKYIQADVGMDGVVSNGLKVGGEDYRTVHGSSVMYLGTIAFNTSPLHNLSFACRLKNYNITFNQRCGAWTGGTELYWTFYPRLLTNVTYGEALSNGGVRLQSFAAYKLSETGVQSKSNGSGYFDDDRTRTLYTGTYDGVLFGYADSLLGFYLQANNPAAFNYKLYLKSLRASVTYEARYRVIFYDDNGNPISDQIVDGGERATAPNVSRTGYTVAWSCDGKSGTYSSSNLPTSEDTDLVFRAVYSPVPKVLGVTVPEKGQLNVYKAINNEWQLQEGSLEYGKRYYTFYYGDHIKVEAVGCNELSEDLIAELADPFGDSVSSETKNGYTTEPIKVYESNNYITNNILTVTPQTHYFMITTEAGAGGTITSTRRIARTDSATIDAIAFVGYSIASVTVDNVAQAVTDNQSWSIPFSNVQADHKVVAKFERIQYSITFDLPQGVSVTANGEAVSGNALMVNHGDEIEFVFSCIGSMSLTGLYLDNGEESLMDPVFKQVKTAAYTIDNITDGHTLRAAATSDLVTISIDDQMEHATITGDTGTYIRQASDSDNQLTFTIEVDVGYGFVRWDDDTTTIPLTFAPTSTRTVSATLEALDQITRAFVQAKLPYYKDATINDKRNVPFIGGKISVKGQTRTGVTISAKTSETTAFSFVADQGFEFESALIRYYDSANPDMSHPDRSETITSNPFNLHDLSAKRVQIEALFRRLTYKVDITPKKEAKTTDGLCSVSVVPEAYTDETYTDPKQYFFESVLTLTATPGTGWYFRKWSDDGGEGKNVRTITVPVGGVELQAIFAKYTFDQHFSACEGGSVTIDGQPATDVTAEYGDDLLLTFAADLGQKIKDVLVDGVSVFEDVTLTMHGGTYLLTNITAAHTVAVVFMPKIYTNGRKLFDYWPPVIQAIRDMQEIARIQQPLIDEAWDSASFLMENQFIDTATEEGVAMWEKELGIVPKSTDTLRQRKAKLRLKWVPHNRFTMRWLYEWLKTVCDTEQIKKPKTIDYALKLFLPYYADWQTICEDLERYMPCNLWLDPHITMPDSEKRIMVGFALHTKETIQIDGKDYDGSEEQG